jgi:hypothetical protein
VAGARRWDGGILTRLGWALGALVVAALAWRLLARRAARAGRRREHAVILHLGLRPPSPDAVRARARVEELTSELRRAVAATRSGEVEPPLGEGDRTIIWLYGADADALLEAVLPVLRAHELTPDSHAIARHGEPGAPEERRSLSGDQV